MDNPTAFDQRPAKNDGLLKTMWKARESYLFIAPFVIIFAIFTVVPVVMSILLSFTAFNVLELPQWVGFANYSTLFLEDDVFLKAFSNTLIIALFIGPIGYLLNLLFAWLINDLPVRVRSVITLIFYAPSISGNVYLIWMILFSGDAYGYLNGILLRMGFINQPVRWLASPQYTMAIVIMVALWSSLGTSFLAFIAGFQSIDRTLYEAASVDGMKNRWQELWFITLPSMKSALIFGSVMSITAAFGVGEICTALCGFPSVDYSVHTLMNHLVDFGTLRYEMGYASAIATLLFVMMVTANMLFKRIIKTVGT